MSVIETASLTGDNNGNHPLHFDVMLNCICPGLNF
jgi:hypothetical protein